MTARIIRAIENPYVDCIGHLSGRKIEQRTPYEFDFEAVLEACVRTGTMLEINSNPDRRDLNELHARDRRVGRPAAGDQLRRPPHRGLRGRAIRHRDRAPGLAQRAADREYEALGRRRRVASPFPPLGWGRVWIRRNQTRPATCSDQRDPEVQPHPEDVQRVVDPQALLEDPEG